MFSFCYSCLLFCGSVVPLCSWKVPDLQQEGAARAEEEEAEDEEEVEEVEGGGGAGDGADEAQEAGRVTTPNEVWLRE